MSKISAAGTIHADDGKFKGRLRQGSGQLKGLMPLHSTIDPERLEAARIEDVEERVASLVEADGMYVQDSELLHVSKDASHRHTWRVNLSDSEGNTFEVPFETGSDDSPQTEDVMYRLVDDAQTVDNCEGDFDEYCREYGVTPLDHDVDEDIQTGEWKEWKSEYDDLLEKHDNLMADGADEDEIQEASDNVEYHLDMEPGRVSPEEHQFNQMKIQSAKFKEWMGDKYDAYANGSYEMDRQMKKEQWQEMEVILDEDSRAVDDLAAPGRSDNERLHNKARALHVVGQMMREDDDHDVKSLRAKIQRLKESNSEPGYSEGFALALEKLDRYESLRD